MTTGTGRPPQELIDEVVRQIVEVAQPLRIILFGSAARGEWNENSDLDILVVMPSGTPRRETLRLINRRLARLKCPKDVFVATQEDVDLNADDWSLILYPALREGIDVYAA